MRTNCPDTVSVILCIAAILLASCNGPPISDSPVSLDGVATWAIQLQGLDRAGAIDRLARADVDLVVIESMNTMRDHADFPIVPVVRQVKATPGAMLPRKLCLAYLNVGQAEDYREYWGEDWVSPRSDAPGSPAFLLAADPDGWAGNWPVAYWDRRWRAILFGSPEALLERAIEQGFDGVMLDWVAGWSRPLVSAAAREAGVDPAAAMADLIRELGRRARTLRPGFLLLLNDGAPLLERIPSLSECVDGVVRESVWFTGRSSDRWDDPANADVRVADPEPVIRSLAHARRLGVRVFTLDYASRPSRREEAVRRAHRNGFVPFVSRTPLDRLPKYGAAQE